jgi:hypothetical protein
MPQHTKIEGKMDSHPLTAAQQTKVKDALVSGLKSELVFRPSHHIEITHLDITWEEAAQRQE